jgi:hypothetical protein
MISQALIEPGLTYKSSFVHIINFISQFYTTVSHKARRTLFSYYRNNFAEVVAKALIKANQI